MSIPIGTHVKTVMGVPFDGVVIKWFYGPFTDGQYRDPEPHERDEAIYVEWNDGTRGWIHQRFLKCKRQKLMLTTKKECNVEMAPRQIGDIVVTTNGTFKIVAIGPECSMLPGGRGVTEYEVERMV